MIERLAKRMQTATVVDCLFLALCCAAFCGCSHEEPGGIVRGKVIYKKVPFDQGSIVFYPAGSGKVAYGDVQKDGTFQLLNANKGERIEPGKYVAVVIAGTHQIAETRDDPTYSSQPVVPFKFSSVTNSPLKYEVVIGENDFELNLDKP